MEFLIFCARLRRFQVIPRRDLLDRFELSKQHMGRKIKYLSHGTIQKLGIIQAFFHEPELLILDEPTNGLDPLMQEEFYLLLKECQAEGCTIFLSSHNLAEVERICRRMAIIRKGTIEKADSIENLRKLLRKKLELTLKQPIPELCLKGAEPIFQSGSYYKFMVTGDLNEVLKQLAELPLADATLTEPALDEIFINFYKEKADD
jgi:ABC-2 type transport system ATP-binding protein